MLNITSKIVDHAFQEYNAAQANGLCTLSWAKALDRALHVHAKVEKRAWLKQLAHEREDAFWASLERKANM